MTTVEQTTAIALGLPRVEQKSHLGNVDFRVGKRIFAGFPAADMMTLRLDPEHARILIDSDPETYVPHSGVRGKRGWTGVTLSRMDTDDLADLIHESQSRLAPKKLAPRRH